MKYSEELLWIVDVQSDWYELVPSAFKDNTICDKIETVSQNGNKLNTSVIRAFCFMI